MLVRLRLELVGNTTPKRIFSAAQLAKHTTILQPSVPPLPILPITMRQSTTLGILVVLCASSALIRLASVQQASSTTKDWPQPQGGSSRRLAVAAASCVDHPVGQSASCLEQSMWGKCKESFLAHACDLSCGRCVSAERRRLLQRVLLVSARQAEPCNATAGGAWAASRTRPP